MNDTRELVAGEGETQDRQIAAALIDDIVEWRIPPGAWIREREIAERFGVSHAPVREAFRHVANSGFVNVVPWRGAHVIEIDRHAVREVFELWKALFGVVCRMAATSLTAEQGRELMQRLDEYDRLVRRTQNTFKHLAASNRIGAFIARNSGAALATEMLNRIALLARWQHHVIAKEFFSKEAGIESARLYRELARALIEREPDLADTRARELLKHLQERSVEPLEAYLAARALTAPKKRRVRT
jgi:DNA-binding GntR family transcriptional regulator